MTVLKTSEQWKNQLLPTSLVILDPNGWNRKNFDYSFYEELIDIDEFANRLYASTTVYRKEDYELINQLFNELKNESK